MIQKGNLCSRSCQVTVRKRSPSSLSRYQIAVHTGCDELFHYMPQLTDISRPRIVGQYRDRLFLNSAFARALKSLPRLAHEAIDGQRLLDIPFSGGASN